MKKCSFIIYCIVSLIGSSLLAQSYPCYPHTHSHDAENNNCKGWAIGRAYGKSASTEECLASTAVSSSIDTIYFQQIGYVLGSVESGDIIYFGSGAEDHAAYVESISSQTETGINMSFVEGQGASPSTGTLYDAIHGTNGVTKRGNPTYIYRKKNLWKVHLENKFGDDSNEGDLKFGGATVESPYDSDVLGWNSNHEVEAIEDGSTVGGYVQRFKEWFRVNVGQKATTEQTTITIDFNSRYQIPEYQARFVNEYSITFRNEFVGVSGYPGSIQVDDTTRSSPFLKKIKKGDEIEGEALAQTINYIHYTFDEWSDGCQTASRLETAECDTIFTAKYTGKPESMYFYDLHVVGDVGDTLKLEWNTHPHDSVSYEVWRKVKPLGEPCGDPVKKATLAHGITTWKDQDYIITDGYTNDLVYYDVRSCYSIEDTYSDPEWVDAFAEMMEKRLDEKYSDDNAAIPESFDIAVFPNPFNPETTIEYCLKESAKVTLTIFDMLGRKIATLVDVGQQAGQYSIRWLAKDSAGNRVSSGMYFYHFRAVPKGNGDIFQKSGKLLLVK